MAYTTSDLSVKWSTAFSRLRMGSGLREPARPDLFGCWYVVMPFP